MKSLLSLLRVLQQKDASKLRTAVPVIGNGLNIQAAREAGVNLSDPWEAALGSLAREIGMSRGEFDRLPKSAPLRWEALVMRRSAAKRSALESADADLRTRLALKMSKTERKWCSLPLYRRVLGMGFENVISLNIDRRLALCSGDEVLEPGKGTYAPGAFQRQSIIRTSDHQATHIWYPYGDTAEPREIRLGMLYHAWFLMELEDWRGSLMQDWIEKVLVKYSEWHGDETSRTRYPIYEGRLKPPKAFYKHRRNWLGSWFDLMLLAPLVFIGASLCLEEWPMWWLLHQRARNFTPFKGAEIPKTFYLGVKGEDYSHLKGRPGDIELVEFGSYDDMWDFFLA